VTGEAALEAAANVFAESEDAGFGDRVDDLEALLAAVEDSGVGEGLEVAGDVGLAELGGCDQFRNVLWARLEGLDEPQAVGFAQDSEASCYEFEGLAGENTMRGGGHKKFILFSIAIILYAHIVILASNKIIKT
jgi:hypothetical protein